MVNLLFVVHPRVPGLRFIKSSILLDAAKALLALKTLGKMPAGSEVIATAANLSTMLALSTALKNDTDAASESLRCVANALLLVDSARNIWVDTQVGGGEACISLLDVRIPRCTCYPSADLSMALQKSTTPDQIFLASRILFLCTVSATSGTFIQSLVEDKHGSSGTTVDIIGAKLDILTNNILAGVKMGREAMTDMLKLTFNLLVYYPKVWRLALCSCELN